MTNGKASGRMLRLDYTIIILIFHFIFFNISSLICSDFFIIKILLIIPIGKVIIAEYAKIDIRFVEIISKNLIDQFSKEYGSLIKVITARHIKTINKIEE